MTPILHTPSHTLHSKRSTRATQSQRKQSPRSSQYLSRVNKKPQSHSISRASTSRSSSVTTSTRSSISSKSSPSTTALSSPSVDPNSQYSKNGSKMSKLSDGLKALISAAHARPGYTRAPSNIKSVFAQLAKDAKSKHVGLPAWVTLSTAASMTLNCPEAMTQLFSLTRELNPSQSPSQAVITAELMREVGLKCISFNGIPRSINCLGAFYNDLPADIKSQLGTTPTREYTPENIESRKKDGYGVWDSVYYGFERKLLEKLAQSHPDLPVHIINSHYSNLLSDPPNTRVPGAKVGRVLTSLVAITCLRSQSGVGPQVTSHVFGLRKAYERGDAHAKGEEEVEGGEWLASEEGNRWILETIDQIVGAITAGEGTTFAPGLRPKL